LDNDNKSETQTANLQTLLLFLEVLQAELDASWVEQWRELGIRWFLSTPNGVKTARARQGGTPRSGYNGHHRMAYPSRLAQVDWRLEQIYQPAVCFQQAAIDIDSPKRSPSTHATG